MNTLLLLSLLLFSCTGNHDKSNAVVVTNAPEAYMAKRETTSDPALIEAATEQRDPVADMAERKLIRNGTLDFKTEEIRKTKQEIENLCREFNAYIASESENNYGDRLQYHQTIRVPAAEFDALIVRIEALAKKTENKNISTQDVTEEFIDTEARLKTKKELEERYREILKQAKTITEIVSIEGQLANVRSEIESMEGRLNYLKNQVAYSTLHVSYYETIGIDFGFASKFVQSLKGGWDNMLAFIIFLVNLWPFVLGLFVFVFWMWRKQKKTSTPS